MERIRLYFGITRMVPSLLFQHCQSQALKTAPNQLQSVTSHQLQPRKISHGRKSANFHFRWFNMRLSTQDFIDSSYVDNVQFKPSKIKLVVI